MPVLTIECPLDGSTESVEIEDLDGDSVDVQCSGCGANLTATYTVSVDVADVEVEAISIPFECPECEGDGSIEVSEESGENGIDCESCGAELIVRWSEWTLDEVEENPLEEDDEEDEEE